MYPFGEHEPDVASLMTSSERRIRDRSLRNRSASYRAVPREVAIAGTHLCICKKKRRKEKKARFLHLRIVRGEIFQFVIAECVSYAEDCFCSIVSPRSNGDAGHLLRPAGERIV